MKKNNAITKILNTHLRLTIYRMTANNIIKNFKKMILIGIIKLILFSFAIFVTHKIIIWLVEYTISLYIYSKIPGPKNIPFIGSMLKHFSDGSSMSKS